MATKASRQPLSRERVLAAAVALADGHGIQALTMRRLAVDLGVEAMSLYYHLPDKETLLDGVAETVIAEIVAEAARKEAAKEEAAEKEAAEKDEDWRAVLRRQFLTARRVMLRHAWAPGLLGTRRTIPATLFAYYDGILGTLVGAGFSYHLAHRALHAFGSMPLGFAQEVFSPAPAGGSMDVDATEEELAGMAAAMPHLTAMMAAEVHAATDPTLGWCDSQVEFEFTLDLLLDGLERLR
ncbi:TetR/AcrR family transcriptional regulator C-terminal domain-containing protein [Dactylosporangium sp. NPDC049525]|uniref:TetR/AcrR family transcriptional regulator n=1 Tax=Dactylosporangium sp. NPDC049525 TaxID=3154730 RepID=UPI00341F7C78